MATREMIDEQEQAEMVALRDRVAASLEAVERVPGTAIYRQMIEVMRRSPVIPKADRNKEQGFMFRGVDSVYEALHGLMAEVGIFTTSRVVSIEPVARQNPKSLEVRGVIEYRFTSGLDGSSVTTQVVDEAMDSSDKAAAKLMSKAHKAALLQAFMIPSGEPDPDTTSPGLNDEAEPTAKPAAASAPMYRDSALLASQFHDDLKAAPHITPEAAKLSYDRVARAYTTAVAIGGSEPDVFTDVQTAIAAERAILAEAAREAVQPPAKTPEAEAEAKRRVSEWADTGGKGVPAQADATAGE